MCFAGGGQTSGGTPVNMGISSQSGTGQYGPTPTATPAPEPKYVVPSIEPDKPVQLVAQPKVLDEDIRDPKTGLPASESSGTTNYTAKKKRDQTLVDN
jgi:hypothetical protein